MIFNSAPNVSFTSDYKLSLGSGVWDNFQTSHQTVTDWLVGLSKPIISLDNSTCLFFFFCSAYFRCFKITERQKYMYLQFMKVSQKLLFLFLFFLPPSSCCLFCKKWKVCINKASRGAWGFEGWADNLSSRLIKHPASDGPLGYIFCSNLWVLLLAVVIKGHF